MAVRKLGMVVSLWVGMVGGVEAGHICTLISDVNMSAILYQRGECSARVSPASTFKLALSLMGFDSGFLHDRHSPALAYKPGDPDWGGPNWLQPTDPERWIKYSVVWYSQRVTHALGIAQVEHYARLFGFGNADLSGDPGASNGLDRSWISSSLKISPLEQLHFQEKIARRELPVSERAFTLTSRISLLETHPDGWEIHGKTGTTYPRDTSGVSDESRGYGWFVGYATRGSRTLAFVQLEQDEKPNRVPTGLRVRDRFISTLSTLAQ